MNTQNTKTNVPSAGPYERSGSERVSHSRAKPMILITTLILMISVLLTGCGSARHATDVCMDCAEEASTFKSIESVNGYAGGFSEGYAEEAVYEAGVPETGTGLQIPDENRKVILSADATLETKEFDKTLNSLLIRISEVGGYVASRQDYNYSTHSSFIEAKIPAKNYTDFINNLGTVANQTSISQHSEDVTESYIETESYLESLRTEYDRFLDLIEEAEDLESVLMIENHLANVRAQLQYYDTIKKGYDNRIAYSTVNINLQEVEDLTIVEPTFGEKINQSFTQSLKAIRDFFADVLLWLICVLPWFVIAAIITVIVALIAKHKKKKESKKEDAKPNAESPAQTPTPISGDTYAED